MSALNKSPDVITDTAQLEQVISTLFSPASPTSDSQGSEESRMPFRNLSNENESAATTSEATFKNRLSEIFETDKAGRRKSGPKTSGKPCKSADSSYEEKFDKMKKLMVSMQEDNTPKEVRKENERNEKSPQSSEKIKQVLDVNP